MGNPLEKPVTASLLNAERDGVQVDSEYILREYDALRAEVISRLETQTQLTAVALALLGGITAVVPFLYISNRGVQNIPSYYMILALLIVALLFSSIMWFFLENDAEMAFIGNYISTRLSAAGDTLLRTTIGQRRTLGWDYFRLNEMYPEKRRSVRLFSFFLTAKRRSRN